MNEDNNRAGLPVTDVEQVTRYASLGKEEAPRFTAPVNIRVTSYRKRNTDPDGVSVKAALDGIVALGILSDDSTQQIKSITFENITAKEEKTIIDIEEISINLLGEEQ